MRQQKPGTKHCVMFMLHGTRYQGKSFSELPVPCLLGGDCPVGLWWFVCGVQGTHEAPRQLGHHGAVGNALGRPVHCSL